MDAYFECRCEAGTGKVGSVIVRLILGTQRQMKGREKLNGKVGRCESTLLNLVRMATMTIVQQALPTNPEAIESLPDCESEDCRDTNV